MQTTLEAFRSGDPDAVRVIYRTFVGPVQTVVASIVGDPELQKDAVQQTFTKAWRAAAGFDVDREIAPWLYAIARRTAIDVLRAEKRPTRGDHAPETDVGITPLSFERTWESFEVRRALDDLPADERTVMKLMYLDGMTQTQIADALDTPVGTVKSRANRAQRRLVAALRHVVDSGVGEPANRIDTPNVEGGGAPS